MKLYLVRHGESEGNKQKIHQGPDTRLTEVGLSQAKILAHRFKKIEIDVILSSPFRRAMQTAEQIAQTTSKEITTDPVFREFCWPSELQGLPFSDPEASVIRNKISSQINNPDWHFSDEENFFDLRQRVRRAINTIKQRPEKNVLLVSHSFFITALISELVFPGATDIPSQFIGYFRAIKYNNTGISLLANDFDQSITNLPDFKDGYKISNWKLISFNDHSHLG
ncbi:MAG: hypothetical protein GF381_02990 [Candidatus Pacebacteria bacterium]|nr:hypothetical protein [Candidatus Paceibacterota bacterium]